jgi:undecaprenyl-diphosphatase
LSPAATGRAAVLGAVQGLTEFAPVSSSGHLVLLPWLLGWDRDGTAFDAALHVGTAAGAAAQVRSDVPLLLADRARLGRLLVAAELPAVLVGGLAHRRLARTANDPRRVALRLAGFGAALAIADRRGPVRTGITAGQVAGMAVAQAVALAPGVSRSGATITAARMLGVDRTTATRFSVWMSMPISIGAAGRSLAAVPPAELRGLRQPLLAGIATSALAGALSARVVLHRVGRHGYSSYAAYRLVVAAAVLLLDAARRRGPRSSDSEGNPL